MKQFEFFQKTLEIGRDNRTIMPIREKFQKMMSMIRHQGEHILKAVEQFPTSSELQFLLQGFSEANLIPVQGSLLVPARHLRFG